MPQPRKVDQTTASKLRKQLDRDEFIQLLSRTTLFRELPADRLPLSVLEEICAVTKIVPLAKNRSLKIRDDKGDVPYLYEILSGYVKIYDRVVVRAEKRAGSPKTPPALLAWRVPGELLGDFLFALPESDLHDHMVATDDCELLRIPASFIRSLAQSYPQLYLNLAANLGSKAIKARVRAQALRLPSIESKVARLFLELLQERNFSSETNRPQVVNGTVRVGDIAAFLGYKRRSTQEGLHNLINNGLIKHYRTIRSGRFEICDERGLNRFIEEELAKARERSKAKRSRGSRSREQRS